MKIDAPKGHEVGMEVPVGGSNCAKCSHVSEDGKRCDEEYFIKWNGSDKLPAKADRYCCDFFTTAGAKTLHRAMAEQKARKGK